MSRLAALLLAALAACNASPLEPQAAPRSFPPLSAEKGLAARLPKRADLPCFPCHSHVKFEKGPFPHGSIGHRDAGHCHKCHLGTGHEGHVIDRTACLSCHEEGAEELQLLSRSGTPSK